MDLYSAECFKTSFVTVMSHNLLAETTFGHNLRVKLTCSGVTVLKDERIFKKRVSGSRSHTVTPHPLLVPNTALNSRGNIGAEELAAPVRKTRTQPRPQGEKVTREYRVNKKLIRHRVFNYLLGQQKPILHAVTISFPLHLADDLGYQALNTWLTVCRQSLHLRDYLYVAERQDNATDTLPGTIHFHLLVPQYLNIVKANRAMAVILANMVRKGKLKWSIYAAKRYNGVHLGKNKTTKRVTNFALGSSKKALANYITKYISKNDQPFTHYAWHNSRGFSAVMTSICLTEAEAKFYGIRQYLNMDKTFAGEFAIFIAWNDIAPKFFIDVMRLVNSSILNKGDPAIDPHIPLKFLLN